MIDKLKENVIGASGYRSTLGGLLIVGLCSAYYFTTYEHLYYCAVVALTGIGLIVFPDQIIPILMELIKAIFGRIIGLIGKK